jgi:hypothetical protein
VQYYNWAAMFLGHAYAMSGRGDQGIKLLTDSNKMFEEIGIRFGQISSLPLLAEAWYEVNDISKCLTIANEAILFAEKMQTVLYVPILLELLGRIHSHPAHYQPAKSRQFYGQAMKAAAAQNYQVTLAHCHAGLGRLHNTTGKKDEARKELAHGCEMYRNMEMTYYLRKAEKDLAELG